MDSARIFRSARAAEAEYERAARRLAPIGTGASAGSCDEYVGRFCVTYDSGRDPLPAEPPRIGEIRGEAIGRLEAAFELNPARQATAFPLVRLLIEHRDPARAVVTARRFNDSTSDRVAGAMLMAAALHADARIPEAERYVDAWLAAADSAERRRLEDLRWLLAADEEKRYRNLPDADRRAYESRFWGYADALYLTPGNETRTAHFFRHAANQLLRTVPVVLGGMSWGNDVAELTIRYGTIQARTQRWPPPIGTSEPQITEHWDPEQMAFAPPEIDSVLRIRARPGAGWPMDTVRSASGHAPPTFRRIVPLEHQVNVFRTADGQQVLRVDGVVSADSVLDGRLAYQTGLFLLDSAMTVRSAATGRAAAPRDSLLLRMELPLPPRVTHYSAELLEERTRLAARARFPVELPGGSDGLFLSTIVVAPAFGPGESAQSRAEIRPLPALILASGTNFGIYSEVVEQRAGRHALSVELEVIALDGSPALIRAARWLGRRLGVSEAPAPRRLAWQEEIEGGAPAPISVTVDPGNLKPGRYIIELAVANEGRRVVSRREILVSDAVTSSRRP